jgi:DNA helicase II / ATP-dependent DNA helicase PcrA
LLVDVETRFPGVEVVRLPVNHRCTPQIVAAGVHVLTTTDQPSPLVSNRADGPVVERSSPTTRPTRPATSPSSCCGATPTSCAPARSAVLARTNAQLGPIQELVERSGLPVRRNATAGNGTPLQATVRQVASLGSASQLRGWAHDVLDAPPVAQSLRHRTRPQPRRTTGRGTDGDPERRVAPPVLEFLREQPLGDGATFRAWVATTNPFDDASTDGVDLLTFHAAKGREWHTVVVTGVESSLVPHKSAGTVQVGPRRVASCTWPSPGPPIACWSPTPLAAAATPARVSPFIADLDLTPGARSPTASGRARVDPLIGALHEWRDDSARRPTSCRRTAVQRP